MNQTVSVILKPFTDEQYWERCLNSIANQSHRPCEVLYNARAFSKQTRKRIAAHAEKNQYAHVPIDADDNLTYLNAALQRISCDYYTLMGINDVFVFNAIETLLSVATNQDLKRFVYTESRRGNVANDAPVCLVTANFAAEDASGFYKPIYKSDSFLLSEDDLMDAQVQNFGISLFGTEYLRKANIAFPSSDKWGFLYLLMNYVFYSDVVRFVKPVLGYRSFSHPNKPA